MNRTVRIALPLITLVMAMSTAGCMSIRSTFVERGPDGKFDGDRTTLKAKGVPVKLKVPTQVEVNIEEVFYITKKGKVIYPKQRILEVSDPKKIYEYQMFTVDVVRPFSGSLNMIGSGQGYVFDENQQLKSLGATVVDNTISTTASILSGEAGKLLGPKKTSIGVGGKKLERRTRVIATKRFSISDPNWHLYMNDWLESYMGNCASQCPVTYECPSCYPTVGGTSSPDQGNAIETVSFVSPIPIEK